MSQENVENVRRFITAFNRKDFDAAAEGLADDVVWTTFLAATEGTGSLHGPGAVRRSWREQAEAFAGQSFQVEALEFVELGPGTLLVPLRVSGRGAASGLEVDATYFAVLTFRRGKIVRVDSYADKDEALEAVGLRE